MTQPHRKWHARLWPPLALLIILGLAAALALRPARRDAPAPPASIDITTQEPGR